jgi:hypothetical protein
MKINTSIAVSSSRPKLKMNLITSFFLTSIESSQ